MPRTVRGIGTKYYGASDRQSDGSFVTTEWITLFAPVIPLRSLRVHYLGKRELGRRRSAEYYNVADKVPLHMKQVLRIYGWHLASWFIVFLPLLISSISPDTASTIAATLMIAVIVFWMWIVPGVLYKAT